MQFRSPIARFRRRAYSQIVSGVSLMLLGALFLLSPLSARSQEPTPVASAEPNVSPQAGSPTDTLIDITEATTIEPTVAEAQPSAEATVLAETAEATLEAGAAPTMATEPPTVPPPELVTPTLTLTPTEQPIAPVTPTLTLTPTAFVTPTLMPVSPEPPADEAPLTITMSAAADRLRPAQQTNLTAIVAGGSATARTARIEVELDPHLEAVSASASSGTCAVDVPVVCTVQVAQDAPAAINIMARVRADAPDGGKLVSQAVARDEISGTAASEPVAIEVHGSAVAPPPPAPTSTPAPPTAAPPASTPAPPTAAPSTSTPEPPTAAIVPMSPVPVEPDSRAAPTDQPDVVVPSATPAPRPAPSATPANPPEAIAQAATQAPSATPAAATATAPAAPTSAPAVTAPASTPSRVPLPDDVFTAPQGENQQLPTATGPRATSTAQATPESPLMPSNNLPHTASHAPLLGWSSMLLGFALVVNGARRVRQQSAHVIAASREARQLAPLVDAITYLNGLAREEAEQMRQVSGEYVDMLKDASATTRTS